VGTNRRQEQSPPSSSNFTTIAAASLTAAECTEQSISGKTNENLQVLFIEGTKHVCNFVNPVLIFG
jgi:hypothetical protein